MTKFFCTILATILFSTTVFSQSIWLNPITGSGPGQYNPYLSGDVANANITVSGIGHGTGVNGSSTTNDRYTATSWTTSNTLDANDYFSFTLTPKAGYKINFASFVYTAQSSASGPTLFSFKSSIDNYTANMGTPTATGATIDLSSFQNITTSITFRLYAYGSQSGSGTFSVNDFQFNGSAPLPVHFSEVQAILTDAGVKVLWNTLSETHNKYFEIEASKDGSRFTKMAIVASKATNGMFASSIQYTYDIDNNGLLALLGIPLAGLLFSFGGSRRLRWQRVVALLCFVMAIAASCNKNNGTSNVDERSRVYIRIAQVDEDGTKTYSKTVQAVRE